MEFSLQDIGSGGGWGGVSENFGPNGDTGGDTGNSGIVSSLENIGVNFAAGAASVGLQALGKSQGISSGYGVTPYQLTRRPGTVSPYGVGFGSGGGSSIRFVGVLLVGGLIVFAAFRRKG
jgi:hypothetical protein